MIAGPDYALVALDISGLVALGRTVVADANLPTVVVFDPAGVQITYAALEVLAQRESRLLGVRIAGACIGLVCDAGPAAVASIATQTP